MKLEFLQGPFGPLFSVLSEPAANVASRGAVLFCPPFADELNKSRQMVATQCRELAAAGFTVMQLDLTGCGDSAGEFVDARWSSWVEELYAAWHWLKLTTGHEPILWGLRSGALLAAEVAAKISTTLPQITTQKQQSPALIFWAPVASGKIFIGQYLRLRLAAGMFGGEVETGSDLRQILASGEPLEVAGYALHPELVEEMEALTLAGFASQLAENTRVHWLDISRADKALSPASERVIGKLRDSGVDMVADSLAAEPFWNTPEITLAPALIPATTSAIQRLAESC